MPLVTRKIVVENDSTTFSKDVVDHTLFVPRKEMKPGDVEVEPVSNDQLSELAQQYPEEYGQKAKDLGIEVGEGTGRLAKLLEMNAKELERQIREMSGETDEAILWAIFEAETAEGDEDDKVPAGKNRKTILEALEAKGIKE